MRLSSTAFARTKQIVVAYAYDIMSGVRTVIIVALQLCYSCGAVLRLRIVGTHKDWPSVVLLPHLHAAAACLVFGIPPFEVPLVCWPSL